MVCSLRDWTPASTALPSEGGQRDRQTCFARLAGWLVRLAPMGYASRGIGVVVGVGVDDVLRRLSSTCAPRPPSTQLVRLEFRSAMRRRYYPHHEHQTRVPPSRVPFTLSLYTGYSDNLLSKC